LLILQEEEIVGWPPRLVMRNHVLRECLSFAAPLRRQQRLGIPSDDLSRIGLHAIRLSKVLKRFIRVLVGQVQHGLQPNSIKRTGVVLQNPSG